MMKRLLIMWLAAFFMPVAASAQPDASAGAGSQSEPQHVRFLHRLANCLSERREADIRQTLAMDFRSDEYQERLRRIARPHPTCSEVAGFDARLGMDGVLFAGNLAEALLRKDNVVGELAARTAYDPARPTIDARNGAELMALCIVRTDPGAVSQLVSVEPAGREELDRLRGMAATLSSCAPTESPTRITREALRALIALAAYRLYNHNHGTAS